MFRFSLSLRQVSKRLIAELASINARTESADAKPKTAAAAAAKPAVPATTTPATTGDTEASVAAVRSQAEGAMQKRSQAEPVVAPKLSKLARKLQKRKMVRNDMAPSEPAGGDVTARRVKSKDDVGDAPSPAVEVPKEAAETAVAVDYPASSGGQAPQLKKKIRKKMAKARPAAKPHIQEENGGNQGN
ncbi:mitochondrial DNA primase [Trypanosoma rangeli]|uniref:Mitochondrial DNA primase n=1 Tax=Trypanosoma rangeli TaxID=5698 RepID=A0A422NER7_TRYRA|nr:mitochondrial DNA primase [Trypanosoma rangeli]RNF03964.1 mitochondrial DNA primase [Trypanosoma rangeli]|eukprot:RNF03964.1 mitochondrial DNA primase [Trypanosoma rangeli]